MFHQIIALLWGVVVGFGIAVPIGPVGIIVVQRTMAKSRMIGLVTGLGSAIADSFLASVGAFGIKIVSDFIVKEQLILRLVGGVILLVIGLVGVFGKAQPQVKRKDNAITIIEHFISGIVLTITNPLAAITFFLAFAGIGPKIGIDGSGIAGFLVAGVFIGACLWWLSLTYIAKVLGHKIKPEHMDMINRIFGFIIAVLGGIILIGALFK